MKPFNLEEAKAGKPVCTRDGRDARIISVDLDGDMPIVAALWNREHSEESAVQFYQNGAFLSCRDTGFDLFMKEEEPKHCCGDACGDNRFEIIEKAKETLLKGTNIESSPEEMTVLDNFLFRCWQMGWLEQYGPTGAKVKEPTLDDYTTIKTYEDACKALDIVPISSIIISSKGEGFWPDTQRCPKHILALMKLETISRALKNGWKSTEDNLGYICIWSDLNSNVFTVATTKNLSTRLSQETEEKAEYFGTQFIELWKEYLITE